MGFSKGVAIFALATTITAPASAWAFTGTGGCSSLPEYYRALGTLQGNMESACDMTVEQARRIVNAYQGVSSAPQPQTRRSRARALEQ